MLELDDEAISLKKLLVPATRPGRMDGKFAAKNIFL